MSVVKPVLQLGHAIENYSKLYSGSTAIYMELKAMIEEIHVAQTISTKLRDKYASARQVFKELAGLDDPKPNKRLIADLQARVNVEIPPESLWYPSDDEEAAH